MTFWPVSARVGNVKNNDPNLDRTDRCLTRQKADAAMTITPRLTFVTVGEAGTS